MSRTEYKVIRPEDPGPEGVTRVHPIDDPHAVYVYDEDTERWHDQDDREADGTFRRWSGYDWNELLDQYDEEGLIEAEKTDFEKALDFFRTHEVDCVKVTPSVKSLMSTIVKEALKNA